MSKDKEEYRVSKSGAKGTEVTTRNSDGVAVVHQRYEVGSATVATDTSNVHRLTPHEWEFLNEYAKDCDEKRAAAAIGWTNRQMNYAMQKEGVLAEIAEIQEVWRLNRKMTAENAAANHIKLIQQLTKDYHDMDDLKDRAKMANPLVKASDTYLKASGHFTHGGGEADKQIVINIDLGDSEVEVSKGKETAKVKKVERDE